ncbi:hypothetical protein TSOC_006019 [Tetrabaena socialis]|uniref:Uncharacterized protein n=1 Tax=Tetrabaena socialis TaxID=47790 RepID=A0A2J8A4Q9_9CHLO|nr:hypothetical protein TSOC_006019 [Tetrabaena socialis]|eukprot:PNH07512.1 hypothetical protein TSOC_006019 [Tetrabaena socialis]
MFGECVAFCSTPGGTGGSRQPAWGRAATLPAQTAVLDGKATAAAAASCSKVAPMQLYSARASTDNAPKAGLQAFDQPPHVVYDTRQQGQGGTVGLRVGGAGVRSGAAARRARRRRRASRQQQQQQRQAPGAPRPEVDGPKLQGDGCGGRTPPAGCCCCRCCCRGSACSAGGPCRACAGAQMLRRPLRRLLLQLRIPLEPLGGLLLLHPLLHLHLLLHLRLLLHLLLHLLHLLLLRRRAAPGPHLQPPPLLPLPAAPPSLRPRPPVSGRLSSGVRGADAALGRRLIRKRVGPAAPAASLAPPPPRPSGPLGGVPSAAAASASAASPDAGDPARPPPASPAAAERLPPPGCFAGRCFCCTAGGSAPGGRLR